MNITKQSWIMKVAIYGGFKGGTEYYDRELGEWMYNSRTDICTLIRRVLWGLIRAPFWGLFFGSIISFFIVFLIGLPLFELYFYLMYGLPFDAFWLLATFDAVIITMVSYAAFSVLTGKHPVGAAQEALGNTIGDGFRFIGKAYRAWKDKTCTFVNIVD